MIIGAILGLIVLAGASFAVYYIFFRPPLPNVSIDLSNNPGQVLVGEPFKFAIAYNNASDQVLKNATVALTVPEGVAIIGVDPSTRLAQQTVGDLDAQAIGSKTFDLLVTGGEDSLKHISVVFRYRLADGDAPAHERSKETDIRVGQSAVSLNLDVPQNVFAEQVFDVGVSYQNNSNDFVFDNQFLSQAIYHGLKVGEISCPAKYFDEASSIDLGRSTVYGLGVLKTSLQYRYAKSISAKNSIFEKR